MGELFSRVLDTLRPEDRDGSHVRKRIPEVKALPVYAAKRVADGVEVLIIEVNTRALSGLPEWPRSKGFEVSPEPLTPGPQGRTRVLLQLLATRYRDVFRHFGDDLCKVMSGDNAEQPALQKFHRTLVHWQSFLQKHPEGLGSEERLGLHGELLILRDLLLPVVPPVVAVKAWRGCKKAHQDFQFPKMALEVKTTRQTIPDSVSISNVQQLDDDDLDPLLLTVVHVHENAATGETLPDLVRTLHARLESEALDLLDSGLQEVGYIDIDAHQELYSSTLYKFLTRDFFHVRDDFPRLTRNQIPDGVTGVRYRLSLAACRDFRVEEAAVVASLRGVTS
jgi:hypothetical protein